MTIEIADRLIKLRKQNGLSQEELADKLGLSRQAVSKWERAEASPDTDNLICLAKLYGVSLDDLLNTDEDIETIVKEQVKEDAKIEQETVEKPEEKKESINITDDEGNNVRIVDNKIELTSADGTVKIIDKDHKPKQPKIVVISGILEGILFLIASITYILLSSFNVAPFTWGNAWIFFLVPEIICSVLRAIGYKKFTQFNMAFTATFAYFFICMVLETYLWHPLWVIFIAIPIWYVAMDPVDKYIHRNDPVEPEKKN